MAKESELIWTVQLPDGEKVKKTKAPDGSISYRRSNGTFVSPKVGNQIEQRASRSDQTSEDTGRSEKQTRFVTKPRTEDNRESAIQTRYPEWDNYSNLDTDYIPGDGEDIVNTMRGWKDNQEVKRIVRNDPLLSGRKERDRAKEALARQITLALQEVSSEKEAMQVLRSYGIY